MTFILVSLATFWAWAFIRAYAEWLPDYVAHFLVPAIAYGMFFIPHAWLLALAVGAVVGLLHTATTLPGKPTRVPVRRRSNIPPPP